MYFLVLTLRDEQSALLLLVSARMATQKTQGIEELKVFNEKAKEVSQYVEVRVRNFSIKCHLEPSFPPPYENRILSG